MIINKPLARLSSLAFVVSTVTACGLLPTEKPVGPKLPDLLSKASQAAAGGNKEQAVALWKQSAAAFPADKTPWIQIAQSRHEAGRYGEAVQAATEVLARDPNDKLAHTIIAIGGLRLANRSLQDLNRQNNLSPSLRSESQHLAAQLRDSVGEPAAVTPAVAQAAEEPEREPARARGHARASKKGKGSKSDNDAGASVNPFHTLK